MREVKGIDITMEQIKKSELKKTYFIKKMLLLVSFGFCVFIFGASIILLLRDGNSEDLWVGIVCGILAIKIFFSIQAYIKMPYHCIPILNQIFSKHELEKLLKEEKFENIKNTNDKKVLKLFSTSEHWFCINNKFISKELSVFGWAEGSSSLNGRAVTPVFFIYMTGEFVKVDLGHKIHIKEIDNFNQYLWEEAKIIPRIMVGEQRENIANIFKNQFQKLKQNMNLSDKGLIETIIQNPEQYRKIYMELLPHHIKKWCEEQNEEERKRLQSNGKKGSRK